jgi:hypothetical protein
MSTCSVTGCNCQNLYTDWPVGSRTGNCEDCGHDKTNHSRQQIGDYVIRFPSSVSDFFLLISVYAKSSLITLINKMATRECTNCGETFNDAAVTVGQPIVRGCNHVGFLRAIPQQGMHKLFFFMIVLTH